MSMQENSTAKNKAHAEAKTKEYREYHLTFIVGTPIFLIVYYKIILLLNTDLQLQAALFSIFFSVVGVGAITVFTISLFTNHLARLFILLISNLWLCYFWVVFDDNLLGLAPVAILYLARKVVRE